MKRHFVSVCGAALIMYTACAGSVELYEGNSLSRAIAHKGYCCIVDARDPANRARDAIEGALEYRTGLRINPSAAVVVIADSDRQALEVGRAIEKSSGAREVLAIKGGATAWRAYVAPLAGAPPAVLKFIIPRNTCESATAIQELTTRPK